MCMPGTMMLRIRKTTAARRLTRGGENSCRPMSSRAGIARASASAIMPAVRAARGLVIRLVHNQCAINTGRLRCSRDHDDMGAGRRPADAYMRARVTGSGRIGGHGPGSDRPNAALRSTNRGALLVWRALVVRSLQCTTRDCVHALVALRRQLRAL